ncbi:MAG: hypothetical protein ACAH24_00180 [Hyphomicrobiaceae bacterium]
MVSFHVSAFVQQRLRKANGASLAAKDLRVAYETWCAEHGHTPLTVPKFATELKALGYGQVEDLRLDALSRLAARRLIRRKVLSCRCMSFQFAPVRPSFRAQIGLVASISDH